MSKRYARNPGGDQVAKWKQALADHHRQQRQQRGRRKQDASSYQPGMARKPPAMVTETDKVGRMGRVQDHDYGA